MNQISWNKKCLCKTIIRMVKITIITRCMDFVRLHCCEYKADLFCLIVHGKWENMPYLFDIIKSKVSICNGSWNVCRLCNFFCCVSSDELWIFLRNCSPIRSHHIFFFSPTTGDRKLSLEEARRLSIVSFTNTPEDSETESKWEPNYCAHYIL